MLTAFLDYILFSSIEIIPLFIIMLVLDNLFFKYSPNIKYWFWSAFFVRLALPFHFDFAITNSIQEKSTEVIQSISPASIKLLQENQQAISVSSPGFQSAFTLVFWIVMTIIAGVALYKVYQLKKVFNNSFECKDNTLADMLAELTGKMKLRRKVKLYLIDIARINSPAVTGIFKPRIFIPIQLLETMNEEEMRAILIHELVHIKRFDTVTNYVQYVLRVLYFFHPLVWYVNSVLKKYREEVCDDISVYYYDGDQRKYSSCLYNVMSSIRNETIAFSLGFSEKKNGISERFSRLLDDGYKPYRRINTVTLGALSLLLVASFGISCDSILENDKISKTTSQAIDVMEAKKDNYVKVRIAFLEYGKVEIDGEKLSYEEVPDKIQVHVDAGITIRLTLAPLKTTTQYEMEQLMEILRYLEIESIMIENTRDK